MPSESPNSELATVAPTAWTSVPLFHCAWIFALGIAAAQWLKLLPSLLLLCMAISAVLCCAAAVRAQRIAWMPLALLWLLLGAWCALMEPHPAAAPALAQLSDGLLRSLEGTVTDAGPLRNEVQEDAQPDALQTAEKVQPSQRIDVQLSSIEVVNDELDAQTPVQGRVRLTVHWPADATALKDFQCGDRVRASARLLTPEVYHDPGVWSRGDYLLDQGITSTASVKLDRMERIGTPSRQLLHCRIRSWQRFCSERLLALPHAMRWLPLPLRLSEDDAVMLTAMVTGDRTFLAHSLRIGFERTGSFHMLVVSGFHLAIVAGCVFWLARRLRLKRLPATLLTIAVSFAYALFTGFAAPVQRSLWMVCLYLLARVFYRERPVIYALFGRVSPRGRGSFKKDCQYLLGRSFYRERNAMNSVGFAALVLLAISPRALFDPSFQMTLLAVMAIGDVAGPLLQASLNPLIMATRNLRLIALDAKLPPRIAEFRVSLRMIASALQAAIGGRFAAGLALVLLPAIVRFALRIVALLVVSFAVEMAMALPMALYFHRITLLAMPVNLLILPLLALMLPLALITLLVALISPWAASLPAMLVALPLHLGVCLVHLFGSFTLGDVRVPAPLLWQSLLFCALLAAAMALAQGVLWQRRLALVAMLAAAFLAIAPRSVEHPRDALLVEAIDVGQGDSILLIAPDGKTLLVDGGGFGGAPSQVAPDFDIGEEVVSVALWARGIRHLDAVALTHAHSDHMGGLPAILRNFHPDELWVGNNPRFAAYDSLLNEAAALRIHVRAVHEGDALSLGETQITVLAPLSGYHPANEPTNNDSVVMRVAYGATSVLLEGDAEAPVEQGMLAEHGLQSTLLKVGHHGSITSTRPEFLARVAPQWAVISCGLRNRYHHPRPEVLEALQTARAKTFSTDIEGAVCFALNGQTVTADVGCIP